MKGLLLVGIMAFGLSGAAHAQDADIAAGKTYAEEICSTCHAVEPGEEQSPVADAPAFQTVADTSGMTAMALSVWLQSSHPTMPNIVLKQDDARNVIAYIESLKTKQ